jgi:glycosyltransferase involved in cell wall biosynthesis
VSPRVSVVIPAYKAAGTICRAVDSVLAQTSSAHEIIVIDDGSPDNQCEIIERAYGERVILIRQANGKTASARNAGIERATGDFIAFLDADDYWEPQKLAKQLAVFEQHPEVAIVAGRYFEQEPHGSPCEGGLHKCRDIQWDRVIRPAGAEAFMLASRMWTGTMLIRRDAIGQHRFLSGLEPAEDRDFWVRILQGQATYFCSEPLATCVLEPGSISRSGIERDCTSMLRVVERHAILLGRMAAREWKSHVLFRWAANEGSPTKAFPRLLQSFMWWPFPYRSSLNPHRFGRVKRLAVLTLLAARIRK